MIEVRQSALILLQTVPKDINVEEIERELVAHVKKKSNFCKDDH